MNVVDLAQLDANLLITLDVLLEERSVTAAARRRGVTQSAMSQALRRLRATFDDPLLVRVGTWMEPTPRAEQLAAPLREALAALQAAISQPPKFAPRSATRDFVVAATDYVAQVLVPALAPELNARAPGVTLTVRPIDRDRLVGELERGRVDVGVGVFATDLAAGVSRQKLFDERFVGVARAGHPILDAPGDMSAFLAAAHVLVAPRGKPGSVVDGLLEARGLARRVAVRVPFFLSAPAVIAASDMVMVLPERLAREAVETHGLAVFEPPLGVGGFAVHQAWHVRYGSDPGSVWLRALIRDIAERL